MAPIPLLVFLFLITHSVLPSSAEDEEYLPKCPAVLCGNDTPFDFSSTMKPECGMLEVTCSDDRPKIRLKPEGHWYRIDNISGSQPHSVISIHVKEELSSTEEPCKIIKELSLPSPTDPSHFSSYNYTAHNSTTLYNCSHNPRLTSPLECGEYDFYSTEKQCPNITLPFSFPPPSFEVFPPLLIDFTLHIRPDCFGCDMGVGECHNNTSQNQFHCTFSQPKDISLLKRYKARISFGGALGGIGIMVVVVVIILRLRKKGNPSHENVDAFLKEYGGIQNKRYSYKIIKKMTNSFAEKLGQGSFGDVR